MNEIRKKSIHFLEAFDIFSYPLSFLFTFKGKFRYSTVSTKALTLFTCAFTFASFFYFARNYLSKSNPQSLLTEQYDVNPGEVIMDPNSFMFTFALENKSNHSRPFIDKTIYKVEAFIETRKNEMINLTQIDVIPCDEKHIPNENPELRDYFNKSYFENLYCFQDYTKVFMKGTWDSNEFFDIKIKVRACDNTTDDNTCKSTTEISKMIEGGTLVMHYTVFRTDVSSYEAPLKIIALDDFQKTTLEFTTVSYLFFSKVLVQTDTGVFQESFSYDEGIDVVSSKSSLYKSLTPTDGFLIIYLRLDPTKKLTTRKYDNLLDVLSKVGGIMRILTVFGALLLKPFLEAAMLQRVSNETFDYEDYLNDNMVDKSQSLSSKSRKVKLSLWEYIRSKLKKRSDLSLKSQILIKSVEMMKKNLDMSLLINKLFDIEKLKLMVKNKEFEVLKNQKPKIILDEKKFRKIPFKTEIEKQFQKNFCIGTDSQALRKEFSNMISESNQNTNLKELPGTSSFKSSKIDKNNEEHKKGEKQNEEFLIELINVHNIENIKLELKESGKFKDFVSPKISEENLEKEINFSKMPDLLSKKNFVEEI